MLTKRRCLFAVVSLSLAWAHPGAGARAEEVVRIGWLRAPNDLTLAKAHGSLEKALAEKGARVTWAGPFAAAPAFEALNADSIDITAGSSTSVITALAANMPVVVFAYQKMSAGAEGILVKKGSPITTLEQLEGKSVAVNRGGTGEYLLVRALQASHIDPDKVNRVFLTPADSSPAFLQGHVDAWATWDPFVAIARSFYDGRVLADGTAIGSDNAVVIVASRAFTDQKRELLQTVFDVIEAENAWALEHKAEAGAIWTKEMNLPAELAGEIGENNAVPTHAVTPADVEQIERIADWCFAAKIVPRKPDVAAGVVLLK